MNTTIESARTLSAPSRASAVRSSLQSRSVREAWRALWGSRLLIWIVGIAAFLSYGVNPHIRDLFDPLHVSTSFGAVGNALAAPAVRWDSIWYLHLAQGGYHTLQDTGFFPLYPLLIHVLAWPLRSTALAGVAISLVATLVGLAIVHRLTELELGPRTAGRTVRLLAFGPAAFYLSAVYTEGLFLALSAGTFYAARRGHWRTAGIVGGLAAMTRVTGVLLLAPVLLLYLYGPRDNGRARTALGGSQRLTARIRTRYPVGADLLWSLLIPAGLAAFCAYTALRGFGFTATSRAQHIYWQHQFTGPWTGIWDGFVAAWHQLNGQLSGNAATIYRGSALLQLGVLVAAGIALIGVCRRLPVAYGAYAVLGILVAVSSPTVGDPLKGLDRYASMMFPLFMWAGAWAQSTRRARLLLIGFAVVLIGLTVQFATWHIVGTIPG